MAHVEKRDDNRWRARLRGPDGRERSKTFTKKGDAEKWLDVQRGQLAKGDWVDPSAGRATFGAFCADWRRGFSGRASSLEQLDSVLRNRILPTWQHRAVASITRGEVQAWVNELSKRLAPATVELTYRRFATVMLFAVEERVIGVSPCRRIALPELHHQQVRPPSRDAVAGFTDALPDHLRAAAVLAAGSGLRQGEVLGLTVDRVDFLRRQLRVDRQLVTLTGAGPVLGSPKTKASVRTVPVGRVVIDELAAHLAAFPPTTAEGFIFETLGGRPWRRNRFIGIVNTARTRAGLTDFTFHDLRHFYASLLIEAGEPSHVIKERLGHASITETHDVYGHLFESADERTRDATDKALRGFSRPGHGLSEA
ncbi:MAG: tyrosine-type recombinase/integrase [Acidimicrobiales bacterium]